MATAAQIKALLRSHADRDDQRFYSTALQVAATKARQGHLKLAGELKALVKNCQNSSQPSVTTQGLTPLNIRPAEALNGLLHLTPTVAYKNDMVLAEESRDRLEQVLLEQRQKDKLGRFNLLPRRKLLFTGPPGTGKTLSAAMLATELQLPLYSVVLDSLITRFMGETASKLRLIFDHIKQTRAVYLFDEFDAIGAQRAAQNDVGEMRRVLNSFLLLLEQDNSQSLIAAATNHPELLDQALHRRFDDIVRFETPDQQQVRQLVDNRLRLFDTEPMAWPEILAAAIDISAAGIIQACEEAAKEAILRPDHEHKITSLSLIRAIRRRHSFRTPESLPHLSPPGTSPDSATASH